MGKKRTAKGATRRRPVAKQTVSKTKGRRFPPEPFEPREVLAMIDACNQDAPSGRRNAAIIYVLWRGGVRVSELLALKPRDIDVEEQTLRIRHGTRKKSRRVALDDAAWSFLEQWLDTRRQLGINGRGQKPVFCTVTDAPEQYRPFRKGRPLQYVYVNQMLKRVAAKAGIAKRIHPHGFRHSAAVDMLREGYTLDEIGGMLGHAHLSTTDRYLRQLIPERVFNAMQSRHSPGGTSQHDS
jgi:integrase